MFHSCDICGDEYVHADTKNTNYLRSTKQWVCDFCAEANDGDLRRQIAMESEPVTASAERRIP